MSNSTHKSPLKGAKPDTINFAGTLLRKGETKTFNAAAIGPNERSKEARGLVTIRKGLNATVQVTCVLGD